MAEFIIGKHHLPGSRRKFDKIDTPYGPVLAYEKCWKGRWETIVPGFYVGSLNKKPGSEVNHVPKEPAEIRENIKAILVMGENYNDNIYFW